MAEEKGYDEFGNNVYDDDNLIEAIKTSKTKKKSTNKTKKLTKKKLKIMKEMNEFEKLFLKYFPKNISEHGYTLDEKGTLIPRTNVTLKNRYRNRARGLRKSRSKKSRTRKRHKTNKRKKKKNNRSKLIKSRIKRSKK